MLIPNFLRSTALKAASALIFSQDLVSTYVSFSVNININIIDAQKKELNNI
jgi:hypothetical protein